MLRSSTPRWLLASILLALLTTPLAWAVTDVPYNWRSVKIQGGGYATGIVIHPLDSNLVYMRCDVAGFYRWDTANARWINLTDELMTDDFVTENIPPTEAVAVDPNDVNKVYIGCGGWGQGENGWLFRSSDKGNTWSTTNLPWYVNGNLNGRWGGERLCVDPNNSNVLYYGTRRERIYKSTDAGVSFSQLSGSPQGDGTEYGVQWIAADKNGTSTILYCGANGGTDGGIYRSTNGGSSWSLISGTSGFWSNRGIVDASGTLWVVGDGVRKMARGGSSMTSVTPPNTRDYGSIGVNPQNTNEVTVATSGGHGDVFYRSTNGGSSWWQLNMSHISNNPATTNGNNTSAVACIAVNPSNPNQVWYVDWYNAWRTDNISADPAVFTSRSEGYEALVALAMSSPRTGVPLMSGGADHSMLRHTSIDDVPSLINISGNWEITGIDYCETDPNYVAIVGGKGWEGNDGNGGSTSTNNGATVTNWSNMGSGSVGLVAVGATKGGNGHATIVWLPKGYPAKRSTDGGQSWQSSNSPAAYNEFFAMHQVLASDRANGSKFYMLNRAGSNLEIYRSTDGGLNWGWASSIASGAWDVCIDTTPGVDGSLWVAADGQGLWRSTNSGSTMTKVNTVQWAKLVTVGPPATAGGTHAVYIHGGVDNVRGVFRSDDNGASWVRIYNQSTHQTGLYRELKLLEADHQVYGRVYGATGGRGIWVGEIGSSSPPPTPTGLVATPGNGQVALSWNASSGATSYNVKRSTTSGSGYSTINSPTTTSYTNTGLTNGTTYYYVVSAVNANGESANSSQVSATPSAPTGGTANIAAGTATIDATVESAWSNATAYTIGNITGSISSTSDASGTFKGLWDSTNLYLLAEVTDDNKSNDSTDPWQDDSVEVYVDGNNDKTTSYDSNDRQYVFGWGDTAVVEAGGRSSTGVTFAKADPSSTTYRIELKVPWGTLGVTASSGKNIGLDVHINDDDSGGTREGKRQWNDTADTAWQNPSVFGVGALQAGGSPPATPTGLAATAGDAQVALSWNASSGATSYNVKRSTTSGSGYSTIASPTTTSYTNTGLTNGTTYYYVVSAVNSVGESANSSQVSATPMGGQVAAPSFSPVAGTYTSAQSVTISTTTSGASIRYTTDGSNPTSTTGTLYSGPVSISTTTTLKAIAYKTGMTDSTVTSGTYTINAGSGGTANIAAGTATIDATVESAWSNATAYTIGNITGSISSTSDASGTFKGLWDSTNLYVLAEVTDDNKSNDSTDPWQDDSVEIYLDGNNDKTTTYDSNDRQYVFGWGDTAVVEAGGRSSTGVTFAKADPTSTTYRIELRVPWSTLGVTKSAGQNIGLDVHINDDDAGGTREGKRQWNDTADTAWQNPSVFGVGALQAGSTPGGSGTISREVWNNVSGTSVSQIPLTTTPSSTGTLTSFEAPTNVADNYGQRVRGYLTAPTTGSYTFWIAADDGCELWLSTNDQASAKVRIAYHTGWTNSREWNKYTTQKSASISLTAGNRYYIEALMKEGSGGDNLAVGWAKPGQSTTAPSEVVPGAQLSPWDGASGSGPIANGTYKIIARHSGKAMDAGAGTTNGTDVVQWTSGNWAEQRFTFEYQSDGYYEIKPNHVTGMNIEVDGGGTANGTVVQIWSDNNTDAQRWKVEDVGGGYWRITPKVALDKCADVSGVSLNDNAPIHIWTYGGGGNQQWQIVTP